MNRRSRTHGRQQMNALLFEVPRAIEASRVTKVARETQAAQKLNSPPVLEPEGRISFAAPHRHADPAPRRGVREDGLGFQDELVGQLEWFGRDSNISSQPNRVVKVGLLLLQDRRDQQRIRAIGKRRQQRAAESEPRQTGGHTRARRSGAPCENGQASQQCDGNQRFPKTESCVLRGGNARHQSRQRRNQRVCHPEVCVPLS